VARSPAGERDLFSKAYRRTLRPNESQIKWVSSALSPRVKQPEREIDHSCPLSTFNSKPMLA
jgi:hypothetical protein